MKKMMMKTTKISVVPLERQKMTLTEYRDWYEILRKDESDDAEMTLTCAEEKQRELILNGQFEFFDIDSVKNVNTVKCTFTFPVVLAACFGSLKTLDVLLEHQVDLFVLEAKNYNLLHCLVCVAFYEPYQEDDVIATYRHLCEVLPHEKLLRLLMAENDEGFRPLEFAGQQGALDLMSAMFETRDVYVTREESIDVMIYQWYDVTEYMGFEDWDRKYKSPLMLMLVIDKRHMEKACHLFCNGVFKDWSERYIRASRLTCVISFLVRSLYILALFVYEVDQVWLTNIGGIGDDDLLQLQQQQTAANVTSQNDVINATFVYCQRFATVKMPPGVLLVLAIYLYGQSICSILFILYKVTFYVLHHRNIGTRVYDLNGMKDVMVSRWKMYDSASVFLFYVLTIVELTLLYQMHDRGQILFAVNVIRLLLTLFALWNIMIYLQIAPGIGHVVIYIREMTADLVAFLFMFCFYTAIFARQFMLFFNVNSKQGCVEDFSSFQMSLYSLYLTMLNMESFTDFDVHSREILYIHHFSYVSIVGILLLNLLIAVFHNTLKKVKDNKEIVLSLSRLSIVVELDYAIASFPLLRKLYRMLYFPLIRSNFVNDGERIFLVHAKNIEHRIQDEASE